MELPQDFAQEVQQAWHRFLQRTEPLCPDLHRYCRALTGAVWDAEDLVQDTLLRAFLGEPMVVVWYTLDPVAPIVRDVLRFFAFCPETLAEVVGALGLPLATNGYGVWAPEFLEMQKQEEFQQWMAQRVN